MPTQHLLRPLSERFQIDHLCLHRPPVVAQGILEGQWYAAAGKHTNARVSRLEKRHADEHIRTGRLLRRRDGLAGDWIAGGNNPGDRRGETAGEGLFGETE